MDVKRFLSFLLIVGPLCQLSLADVKFLEEFSDNKWADRWIVSKHKDDYGEFKLSSGKYFGDEKRDQGLKTSQDAKFYAISAKFPKKFSNRGKTLVVQLTVKHEQGLDCGGGYVKVMSSNIDQSDFHGETPYNLMFGPDICGPSSKKVHVIFSYKGKNHLIKKDIRCKDDELTHLYTLILKPDNTYEVQIDGEKVEGGNLEDDWDFLPPKKIKDPDSVKPSDWVDNEFMDDPEDEKPKDWDKPEHISDPEAKKPEDWDDDMDGEWEAPMIDNPEFKGDWKPKQIKNPDFKGAWIHPEIDNPEYEPDDDLYLYKDWGAIGIDIWQVKSGTIFDNILVADDVKDAVDHAAKTFKPLSEVEKVQKDKDDEEQRKKMEEESGDDSNLIDPDEDEGEDEDEDEDDEEASSAKKKTTLKTKTPDSEDDEDEEEDESSEEIEAKKKKSAKKSKSSKKEKKSDKKSTKKSSKKKESEEEHDEL